MALIAAYDAALAAGAKSPDRLAKIRDEHVAHLKALGWDQPPAPTVQPRPSGRKALVRAERRAARARARAAAVSEDSERAQILALIAASEAQHVVTLERA